MKKMLKPWKRLSEWHRWYAWYPVIIRENIYEEGALVWLGYVNRRMCYGGWGVDYWEYKLEAE